MIKCKLDICPWTSISSIGGGVHVSCQIAGNLINVILIEITTIDISHNIVYFRTLIIPRIILISFKQNDEIVMVKQNRNVSVLSKQGITCGDSQWWSTPNVRDIGNFVLHRYGYFTSVCAVGKMCVGWRNSSRLVNDKAKLPSISADPEF